MSPRSSVPPDQWEAFLKQACAGDEDLHRQVSELLQAHQQAGSFLDEPVAHLQATRDLDPAGNGAATAAQEGPGTLIGPYKLLEQIGEGGMGEVWMAEQRQPIQRKVALKIIKAGMDTRQVVARFEAERQALALMDHPNIAKVLDARRHRRRPALLRDGAGQGHADHHVLRRAPADARASGWSCSCRSARRSSTPTRRGSSTATSSPRTS